ncbi:restriction endonuclease [Paenibacillus polymyxa]|uniref:restriction endonuclease n=1 Tax=Paenibacillus polymyxa TaxID=1406 RepID=UPI002AB5B865|nr:restriction endonuclease [Paenibacillus polymyxa]MDY8022009.1 restriction endonuclease [Paenibacillus polymyxa]
MKQEIIVEYEKLSNPPKDADGNWYRQRGRKLETLVQRLLELENLEPRMRYRPEGEEIDGSFLLGDKVYLLELKWHSAELPASSIYQFKGKVDGKLLGTIGIFISLSGYSKDAVDALSLGKTLNVILFDKEDFEVCIKEDYGFRKVLTTKLRQAAEEGIVFFPYNSVSIQNDFHETIEPTLPQVLSYQSVSGNIVTENPINKINTDIILICEGNRDREILLGFMKKIMKVNPIKRVTIVVAMGKYVMPKVINSVRSQIDSDTDIFVIVDSDGEIDKTMTFFKEKANLKSENIIITDPYIETWIFNELPDRIADYMQRNALRSKQTIEQYIKSIVDSIEIDDLLKKDSSFEIFYKSIIANEKPPLIESKSRKKEYST